MIKAAGGGGEGMKIVEEEAQLKTFLIKLKVKQKIFGNDELCIEKYFKNPRHIEVQIMWEEIEQFI